MIDVLTDLVQSAAILAWAILMIFVVRRIKRLDTRLDQNSIAIAQVRENRGSQDPQPICGCGHHQCFHDETGCGKTEISYYQALNSSEHTTVPCGCKRYTGPEPLPTVIP